jgi:hypothetical protein
MKEGQMTKEALMQEKKTYKIITAPEGQPTFIDSDTGVKRPYIRIHLVRAYSEEEAKRVANDYNYDIFIDPKYDDPMYEIMSVEVEE